jgi:hypothetical protein
MKQGKCTNIEGRCSKAISQEVIEYEVTADPECPECGRTLEPIPIKITKGPIPWKTISIVVFSLLLIGSGIWWWINRPPEVQPTPPPVQPVNIGALQDSIRHALDYNRFKDASRFSKELMTQTMNNNQPRESLIPFYNEIKQKADAHYQQIIVDNKDCNMLDIPFRYYVCAYTLNPNNTEKLYIEGRLTSCEEFAKSNCTGITIERN